MTERPILFSAPMVRALLAGTKTQTRRVVKPQFAADAEPAEMGATNERGHQISGHSGVWWCDAEGNPEKSVRCPYGQPGDRLWVRETFQRFTDDGEIIYKADPAAFKAMNELKRDGCLEARWRPSIHMPRWASRILLEVTAVRVERLQDISRGDAMAEGIQPLIGSDGPNYWTVCVNDVNINAPTAQDCFGMLWGYINGADSWAANPWVWVVEFKRVQP